MGGREKQDDEKIIAQRHKNAVTHTRPSVLDGLVRAREFAKVVACHLRLDLHRVEDLAVVNAHDGADHLRDDDHVAQVRLDDGGLLIRRGLLLGLAQLRDEAHGLALQAALEAAAYTSVDDLFSFS